MWYYYYIATTNEKILKIKCFLRISVKNVLQELNTRAQSYQQKNSQNSDQILRFLKISTDFQIVLLSKYSEENFQKSVQPAAPKKCVRNFYRFSEKIGGFKILRFLSENFSDFSIILIGLSPGLLYNLNYYPF